MKEGDFDSLLRTAGGKPIFPYEYVDELRKREEKKNNSNFFIAQEGAQENDLHSTVDILVTGGNRGGGKANTYQTPVITPSGVKKMGELQVGDLICTPYEGIQKVKEIFEQGVQTAYTFHFDDGTVVRCMDNHQFWARAHHDEPFMVWDAREIMNLYKIGARYPGSLRTGVTEYVEFPLCGEVKMVESRGAIELPIDPGILGMISRTGVWEFGGRGIRACKSSYLVRMMYMKGYIAKKCKTDNYYYIKSLTTEQRRAVGMNFGTSAAKVPAIYMTASVEARWQYLKGLMGEKPHMTKNVPYIIVHGKKFAEDVAQLARSLGIWAYCGEVTDSIEQAGLWRVNFFAPNNKNFFYSEQYKKAAKENGVVAKRPDNPDNLTKKLLYVARMDEKVPCRCITVTGKDHLYLTDGFTVNHNTALMLMEGLYDINNKHFHSVLFRKNKDDFANIENESRRWFRNLGRYNKSKDDMTWNFKSGAKMSFDHFDMTLKDFEDKYRGQQYAYIGIDEFPQMPFEFMKILMGSNRNTIGVRSRILGTCNPDPLSWLRRFIDWWIGKEDTVYSDGKKHPERKGLPIPERDGVIRYCFMGGNSVDDIVWGDTPQEVYEQCREEIDSAWDDDFAQYGWDKMTFAVKSVTFIKASIKENKALLRNDPGYVASILNKSPEERAREWDGNWDVINMGNDTIQPYHMERIFTNPQMRGDNIRRASCDVAGTGGDNCVTWLWIGWHVADVYVCRRDPYSTVSLLQSKLREWGVLEQNFTYDLNGMGQVLKGAFPKAVPFNNMEAVNHRDKGLYDNIKSQCAYRFAEKTQQGEWSIEPTLLDRKYKVGSNTNTLRDILQRERKCIKQDMSRMDKGWCLIHKEQMKHKSLVGHSPDFFEALFMREVFELKHPPVTIPTFLKGHVRSMRSFSFVKT